MRTVNQNIARECGAAVAALWGKCPQLTKYN